MAAGEAILLKEQGNSYFKKGDYNTAEGFYSKAIIADPSNIALYTNRAMTRIRLRRWDDASSDCQACLDHSPDNMKARFLLAQAQLELGDYDDALDNARAAYDTARDTNDRSMAAIAAVVLRAKKERWDDLEKKRLRGDDALLPELLALLEQERERERAGCAAGSPEAGDVDRDFDAKAGALRAAFARGRGEGEGEGGRREVPDWAIDDITFGVMVDPVVTKTGKSYERSSILEHLRRSQTDPITREPLLPSDLRPNLDLRAACEEFLDKNGWAVDW